MFLFKSLSLKLKNLRIIIPKRDLLTLVFVWFILGLIFVSYPFLTRNIDLKIKDTKIEVKSRYLKDSFKTDILLVSIDSETLSDTAYKWPWPQEHWAKIIGDIKAKGKPKAIILDIYFQDSKTEATSKNFIKAIKEQNNTGLVAIYEENETIYGKQIQVAPPIKEIDEVAAFTGISQQPIDEDGKIRTLILREGRIGYNHVALEVLKTCKIPISNASAFLNMQTPVAMLDFPVTCRGLNQVSIKDLNDDERNYEFLKDRIVIIGATANVLHDYHQTPFGLISGPEIICNTIESIGNGHIQLIDDSIYNRIIYYLAGVLIVLFFYSDLFKQNSKQVLIIWLMFPIFLFFYSFLPNKHPPIELTWLGYTITAALFVTMIRIIELSNIREQLAEASICSDFQKGLFPNKGLKDESGICCHGTCIPYQNAGGDYYDFFKLKNGNIFYILCDVSGHGISASMITTVVKSLVVIETANDDFNLDQLFNRINFAVLNITKRKKMVTIVGGIINTTNYEVSIYSAGHIPAIHKLTDGYREIPLPAYPLGIYSTAKLKKAQTVIKL
ncbi:MAG: CHASE2 domain-containing protein, partial [Candidatus Riflebacteria bacterium]|nr:CHASE2 domain-containing protein [Candidatus Riflebacteria bacterium]